ncbi:hypothetical protein M422DRAFT_30844 [Sphaerobolus stellatus SS14]|uniref:Uncharacterized protein n=1 Tax=Sphaerobolus stellatus (strain SS14) TaxID=990650 RepID=A0A0C9V9C8_SPHS4|nr:hypothetical protein M422DRAFT_30844 [Sphaerobolus stellatus SS14]
MFCGKIICYGLSVCSVCLVCAAYAYCSFQPATSLRRARTVQLLSSSRATTSWNWLLNISRVQNDTHIRGVYERHGGVYNLGCECIHSLAGWKVERAGAIIYYTVSFSQVAPGHGKLTSDASFQLDACLNLIDVRTRHLGVSFFAKLKGGLLERNLLRSARLFRDDACAEEGSFRHHASRSYKFAHHRMQHDRPCIDPIGCYCYYRAVR